jgi:hypothetical protein
LMCTYLIKTMSLVGMSSVNSYFPYICVSLRWRTTELFSRVSAVLILNPSL